MIYSAPIHCLGKMDNPKQNESGGNEGERERDGWFIGQMTMMMMMVGSGD